MAWEKRGKRTYYYRCIRSEGKVKKVYYGTGPVGRVAANIDAVRRAERQAAQQAMKVQADRLDAAVALTRELGRACELLTAATLLAAGFHRPSRHPWRRWRHGRKVLRAAACAARRGRAAGPRR